jgi:hypothetical protein
MGDCEDGLGLIWQVLNAHTAMSGHDPQRWRVPSAFLQGIFHVVDIGRRVYECAGFH